MSDLALSAGDWVGITVSLAFFVAIAVIAWTAPLWMMTSLGDPFERAWDDICQTVDRAIHPNARR